MGNQILCCETRDAQTTRGGGGKQDNKPEKNKSMIEIPEDSEEEVQMMEIDDSKLFKDGKTTKRKKRPNALDSVSSSEDSEKAKTPRSPINIKLNSRSRSSSNSKSPVGR